MIQTELERLAAMAYQLRPDWPIASTRTHLASLHAHRAYRDVAVALAWIACDPETRTPARLAENGPWWRAALVEQPASTPQPPPRQRDPNHVPAPPDVAFRRAQEARERIRAARAATVDAGHDTTCNPEGAP